MSVRRSKQLTALLTIMATLFATFLTVVIGAPTASATHYRANQLTWEKGAGATDVHFHVSGSWRCSFFFDPCSTAAGQTFTAGSFDFGDGTFDSPAFTVVSFDDVNDVVTGEAHVDHTYPSGGPFTAAITDCCRLSDSGGHMNNPDGEIRYETLVDLTKTTASPVGLVSPIVDCPLDALCQFTVPAADPDGQPLAWRLSTAAEAGTGFAQPAGATISATTGLYSWNTTGAALAPSGSTFYSTQVMVENVVAGVVVSRTAVDFFIRLGSNSTNQQPVFVPPTPADGAIIPATVGVALTVNVAATDPDSSDTVTTAVLGLPAGSTYTPTNGNPASGVLSWTPTSPGDYPVTFTAHDQLGLGAIPRGAIIRVAGASNPPPVVDAGPNVSGNEGSAVSLDGTITDTEAVTSVWSASPGAGVDAGASCSFGNAALVDTTVTCTDDGVWTLTLTGNDGTNSAVADTTTLTVSNVAPSVAITAPADTSTLPSAGAVNVAATVTDQGINDTHTCVVDWGDGTTSPGVMASGTCPGSHTYAADGVYTIRVTATDDDLASGFAEIMVTMTSAAQKVTGGGYITTGGRTSFGFIARPQGSGFAGQLQVRAPGQDRFHGNTVTAMSVSGKTATWSGTGSWNKMTGFTFTVSVVDNRNGGQKGTADTISITIKNAAGVTVYSTAGSLKGGNLTIH